MYGTNSTVTVPELILIGDRLHARIPGKAEPVQVKVVWTRPVSARGREVSIVGPDKKEIVLIRDVEELDEPTRDLLRTELERRYGIAVIRRVARCWVRFGNRYWEVETDRGPRVFLIRNPGKNITYLSEDHLLIRDVAGNRFEIPSLAGLDKASRREIERVL
jgi:hypothetical protein